MYELPTLFFGRDVTKEEWTETAWYLLKKLGIEVNTG